MERSDTTKSEKKIAECFRKYVLTLLKVLRICKRKKDKGK